MNLTPWQYELDVASAGIVDGRVRRGSRVRGARAQDAFAALTKALGADASHPLAAHALVHLTESLPIRNARFAGTSLNPSLRAGKFALRDVAASPWLGEAAADALFASFAKKSPKNTTRAGVSPHLAHMAAHTYARVGRFRSAVDASLAATRADDALTRGCVWPYGEAHNRAMLVAAAAAASSGPEGERVAYAAAADPGTADSLFLDQHAGFPTAFHDVPKLLVAASPGGGRSSGSPRPSVAPSTRRREFGTAKKTSQETPRRL